jgi:hypothetical protein
MSEKPKHLTTEDPHGEFGPEVRCICGWRKRHPRQKVRMLASMAHLTKNLDDTPRSPR